MEPVDLDLPPGVVKADSASTVRGRYIDADKVRFYRRLPEKIGGTEKLISDQLTGAVRSGHAFLGPDEVEVFGFGTNCKLYFLDASLALSDITPDRASGTLGNNPLAVVDGSTTVTVTHTSHGASLGDTVNLDGATAVGGITPDGDYLIASVVNANSYTITHSSAATSTASGGGASVDYTYEVACGVVDPGESLGYGMGPYGEGSYGTPRASGIAIDPLFWSLDNYGDNLMAAQLGGTIYLYDDAADTIAQAVSNAPTTVRYAFVTDERFLMALLDDMIVKWPDQSDTTDWTPSSTNTANSRTLQHGSKLIAGTTLRSRVFLVWSDTGLYEFLYTGSRLVYNSELRGTDCGLIGPAAFALDGSRAFWMSKHNFFMFDGSVREIPNQKDIHDFVYDGMNEINGIKSHALYFPRHREIWFFYTTTADTEPDRYVILNIDEWHWTPGTMERMASCLRRRSGGRPVMVDQDGYIHLHELMADRNDDGSAMAWYLESGLLRVGNGKATMDVVGFIPDFETQVGDITLTVRGQDRPESSSVETETATISAGDEIEDLRLSGRHFGFKLAGSAVDSDFRLGVPQIEIQPGALRR